MSIDVEKFYEEVRRSGVYWECPYCKNHSRIQFDDISRTWKNRHNQYEISVLQVFCPNPQCRKPSIYFSDYSINKSGIKLENSEMLYPHGVYNHYPDFVPEPIRKDYEEAACIASLSPKASAALIRRALQGMIKHKWPELKDKKLMDQINLLDEKVPIHQKNALHGIRKIGNVGAHMHDPGVIANQDSPITVDDVDKLIKLLEYLIKSWYVDEAEAIALMEGVSDRGDEIHKIQREKL